MSVSSILAFVLAGTAAFRGPRDRADESPKRTAYKALKAELSEAKARIAELEDALATANDQARRDQELIDHWCARALHAERTRQAVAPVPFGGQHMHHAQQNALAQAAVAQQMAKLWRNCVPARHDLFLQGQ